MNVGIFDHLDRGGADLATYYEQRLQVAEAYDRAGLYCYHLAEHHATPLGMGAAPSVFLAALAQRTKRLRFGPLVYLLPFYHPLRLLEEIAMLDQLSAGRLEFGVGRGIAPVEMAYYGVDQGSSAAVYDEALQILMQGMSAERLTFSGKHFDFKDVPLQLWPRQKPHPPMWYGVHGADSAERAAARGFNVVTNEPPDVVAEIVERLRGGVLRDDPERKIGAVRFIVVADDDATATAAGRAAYPRWKESFYYLHDLHGIRPAHDTKAPTFDEAIERRLAVAGSPERVAAALNAELAETNGNYIMGQFAFGDLPLDVTLRSVELFGSAVLPALRRELVV